MTRPRHEGSLWHTSYSSNGVAITSNYRIAADGLGNAIWSGPNSVSYASNSNDVAAAGAAGASTLVSRADHVHRGVTSLSHSSNTFYGSVTFTTPGNTVGITSPASGTYAFTAVGGGGGGGGASNLASASYKRTAGDYTTASATFVDVDATNLALTITTGLRKVMIGFAGTTYVNNTAGTVALDVLIDGTRFMSASDFGFITFNQHGTASEAVPSSFVILTDILSAASHTFKLQWRVGNAAHTATMQGGAAGGVGLQFWVAEMYLGS